MVLGNYNQLITVDALYVVNLELGGLCDQRGRY